MGLSDIVSADGVQLRRVGDTWRGLCPFHDSPQGRNPSFMIKGERWRCWSCGESGDGISYVMKRRGLTYPQALDYLGIERQRPTRQDKARINRERRKQIKDEWCECDLAWTLGKLIRLGHRAMNCLTPENLHEYGGLIENVATWERWHDVLIYGDKEEKAALMQDLAQFPVFKRGRLFREDFNFNAWLCEVTRKPEGKPEPQNEIKTCSIEIPIK